MVNQSFQIYSLQDWEQKAEDALKGNLVESLNSETYEYIKMKPLYSKEDVLSVSQYPGQADFRRGYSTLGYLSHDWNISQKIDIKSGVNAKESLLAALQKGQSAIAFDATHMQGSEIKSLIEGIHTEYPLSIELNKNQAEILSAIFSLSECEKITGYVAIDPVAQTAINGGTLKQETYDRWVPVLLSAHKHIPKLRTILINTSVYHNAGGNAVQELAAAMATAVNHIEELLKRGLKMDMIIEKMIFKFSIGSHFFMEISKLRAAKLLWGKVLEAYGVESDKVSMVITAETSSFTKTVYDPYVNVLRSGNEAFAAVLGGIQYLHVSSFNEPEGNLTPFSERIARNTQLILKNEAHLQNVVDPAGGSWYIEALTNELAEKGWALFLQIEERDGMSKVLETGWLQAQIAEIQRNRREDIYTRSRSIIGTNVYANLNEQPKMIEDKKIEKWAGIPQLRLAEPYEELRTTAEKIARMGKKAIVGLICLGELKSHKARADFIKGFFAAGGIHSQKSQSITYTETVLPFIDETKHKHYILCGTNQQYEDALEMITLIKKKHPLVKLYLAGLPELDKQEQFKQAGITHFIHARSNCYEILSSLLSEMEAESNE